MNPYRFHAVGIVAPATGETMDDLADWISVVGCDYLGDDDATAIVSCGPFLSTSKNIHELAGDARHHLAKTTQRQVLTILNVTNDSTTIGAP